MTSQEQASGDSVFLRKDGPYSWIVLLTIAVASYTSGGFTFAIIGILTDEYVSTFDMESTQANLVGSVLIGTFLFSFPISAVFVKYFGSKGMSTIGFVFSCVGFTSSAFATEFWHFLLGYSIVTGISMSCMMTATIAVVPVYFEKRINVAYMTTGLGSGVALASFPYIYASIRAVTSYRNTILYLLPILLCSVAAPIVYKTKTTHHEHHSPKELIKSWFHPFKRYITIFYLLNAYFWNAAHIGIVVLLFTHISEKHGKETATSVQTVFGIMQAVGGVLLTIILLKVTINHYILHIIMNILAGIASITLGISDNIVVEYLMAAAIGFFHVIVVGNMACMCRHLYPVEEVEYAYAFINAIGGLGGYLGPLTAGLIQQQYNADAGLFYLAGNILFGAVLLVIASLFKPKIWKPLPVYETNNNNVEKIDGKREGNSKLDDIQITKL